MEKSKHNMEQKFIKKIMPKFVFNGSLDVIFGIEHVMGFSLKVEEDLDILPFSTESSLVDLRHSFKKYYFFFYPYFDKLIFEILSWGWSVNFYNNHKPEFDRILIFKYFTQILAKYVSNPEKIYTLLLKTRRIEIHSGNKMKSTFDMHSHQSGFDVENFVKIDASIVNYNPENVIIIEHNRSLILGSNYPFIALDKDSSINFALNFEVILDQLDKGFTKDFAKPYDNGHLVFDSAFYIAGILFKAKNLLMKSRVHSLKQALDIILHNESYYKKKHHRPFDTPWYLTPLRHKNPKREEFIEIGKKILKKWDKR